MATHLSALARPGRKDDEYLWFDAVHRDWLQDCRDAWPDAVATMLKVLYETCGDVAERQFFTVSGAVDQGKVPIRFGYYAGWQIVRDLERDMSLPELLALSVPTAAQYAHQVLSAYRA